VLAWFCNCRWCTRCGKLNLPQIGEPCSSPQQLRKGWSSIACLAWRIALRRLLQRRRFRRHTIRQLYLIKCLSTSVDAELRCGNAADVATSTMTIGLATHVLRAIMEAATSTSVHWDASRFVKKTTTSSCSTQQNSFVVETILKCHNAHGGVVQRSAIIGAPNALYKYRKWRGELLNVTVGQRFQKSST